MPRANPNASFEVATKHLFRHLDDADGLRANPLTRAFFAEPNALERIRELLHAAAARCRDEDVAAGQDERARRRYAIAVDECLGKKHARAVACELGISSTQYYRERAHVRTRMARYLRDATGLGAQTTAAPFDAFRYGMRRAATFLDLGDAGRAIEEYRRLFGSTDSTAHRIEILCEIALAYARGDEWEVVERELNRARTLLARPHALSSREHKVAEAHVLFVRGMSAWRADPAAALDLFASAVAALERVANASEDVKALHVRILFEYAEGLATVQGLRKSVETMALAAKALASCSDPSPNLSLRIAIAFHGFRNAMLVDPFGWEPMHQRLQRMLDLGERARLTGSVDLNLTALNGISQLHACSGNAVAARHAVQSALALAKYNPTKEVFSEVSLRMARTLMYTPLWRDVPNVLRAAGAPATAAVAASRKTLETEFALRCGMFAQARDAIGPPEMSRRPFLAMLAAQAADGLGKRREALALIEPALPEIERSGIAVTIGRTYRIAGQITNDRRYRRKAEEVERATGT